MGVIKKECRHPLVEGDNLIATARGNWKTVRDGM